MKQYSEFLEAQLEIKTPTRVYQEMQLYFLSLVSLGFALLTLSAVQRLQQ